MEKIRVLDELHAGQTGSAVGGGLNVNQSTIYVKQGVRKPKHT